jgi:hypothetical protein
MIMSTSTRGRNETVNNRDKALPSSDPFVVRFVPAEKGLQTQERVFGRRAFPARSGHQPQAGESWLVVVDGDNPSHSVYFVKCLERVTVGDVVSGRVKMAAPRNVKPVHATGKDVLERLRVWNTPVKGVDMNNLRFAFAQKRVAQDHLASTTLAGLNGIVPELEEVLAALVDLKAGPRAAVPPEEFSAAVSLYKARKAMALVKANQGPLQAEILAYGRMMREFNALTVTPGAEQLSLVQSTKAALDQKRSEHKAARTAAEAAMVEAEEEFKKVWEPEYVEPAIEFIADREALEENAKVIRERLTTGLASFEEYVATILD